MKTKEAIAKEKILLAVERRWFLNAKAHELYEIARLPIAAERRLRTKAYKLGATAAEYLAAKERGVKLGKAVRKMMHPEWRGW